MVVRADDLDLAAGLRRIHFRQAERQRRAASLLGCALVEHIHRRLQQAQAPGHRFCDGLTIVRDVAMTNVDIGRLDTAGDGQQDQKRTDAQRFTLVA